MRNHRKTNLDLVRYLSLRPKERLQIFLSMDHDLRAHVMLRLTKRIQRDLARQLPDEDLIDVLEHLDPDEATDLIQILPPERRSNIILRLSETLRSGVELLAKFDPKTAAGLMHIDYILVSDTDKVSTVGKKFKAHEKRTGRAPVIVAMRDGKLAGIVPVHELVFARSTQFVRKFVKKIPAVFHDAELSSVLKTFKQNPHAKVVVIGNHGNVLGIIYSDDVLRAMEELESASLYDFAGVHDEESVTDRALVKVRFRYKWLMINLATAFLASFTVRLFDETISKYVLLAVYMPIVAGMGGNAATQTLAVLVRGIALKEIDLKHCWRPLLNEIGAALVNGLINGILVAAVILLLNQDIKLALVLGIAMIFNLIVAAIFGTLVPLVMQRIGKDPAASATIFITTATDVLGFLLFLGLATIIL